MATGETSQTQARAVAPAFKEWAVVIDSLLRGETSLLFRKGGIAEGREGFRFKYSQFYLFPTYFHEQSTRVSGREIPDSIHNQVTIRAFVEVEFTRWIERLEELEPWKDLHILSPDVIERRFWQDASPGLHLAFVRAYELAPEQTLAYEKRFGGCRSWIEIPAIDATRRPAISDTEQKVRREIMR